MTRTEDEMVAILRKRCEGKPQQEVARAIGVSPQYLCDLLKERRPITETVAERLGFKRVVIYEKIEEREPISQPFGLWGFVQ